MSRYVPSDYRGPNDRPRSPRFNDRRPSVPSTFNNRPYESPRDSSTAPRGPRSQFESARPAQGNGPPPAGGQPRSSYVPQLRDLPPLGSSDRDRGRPFKERDFDRRDRAPTPPERSPPRPFRDSRDFAPRDADGGRGRRGSRDGPLSAGSTYPEAPPFSSSSFRGGFSRGRGRGDFDSRGARGGRRTFDDRDLFRPVRDRSPPPRWGRDLSRDSRDADRRDDRRFERRDDDRRTDWADREPRREQPPPRAEPRHVTASANPAVQREQQVVGPQIDPGRLALLESTGVADTSLRRGSATQISTGPRREQPETPSYLNGRAENVTSRYGTRGSSPPTQAPPVPAFTLSFAAPPPAQSSTQAQQQPPSTPSSVKQPPSAPTVPTSNPLNVRNTDASAPVQEEKPKAPVDAPVAPKAQAQTQAPPPKPQISSPPPAAPKAPRAHETDANHQLGPRLHGVRSWDSLPSTSASNAPRNPTETFAKPSWPSSIPPSPSTAQTTFPSLNQPVSPTAQQGRFVDFNAPTGPRAARKSPALPSASPRLPFTSPRADHVPTAAVQAPTRSQTPPPSAPSGPRNQSYSVSPKATTVNVPTGPRASRVPPTAPRGTSESAGQGFYRQQDRLGSQPWAPPGSRGVRWNQWKPGFQPFPDKTVPAKRDFNGDEKDKPSNDSGPKDEEAASTRLDIPQDQLSQRPAKSPRLEAASPEKMEIDPSPTQQRNNSVTSHSAKQSFLGQPVANEESDVEDSDMAEHTLSSEDEDELDAEDLTLFEAKFERQKRELEAQMVDLSAAEYRATTPLESIARLDRITMKDAQRYKEREYDAKMDIDEPQVSDEQQAPPTTHSLGSADEPEIRTPHGDNDGNVAIEDNEDQKAVRRLRKPSPEVITLPYLLKQTESPVGPLESGKLYPSLDEDARGAMATTLVELDYQRDEDEMTLEDSFAENYRKWREECEDLDRLREDQDSLERQQSLEPIPEPELPPTVPINPILEGRRLHKFSSEYDIEKVLKESEETARIEQERQEREALKAQADLLKEATLPDQLSAEDARRTMFIDHNRYRSPESLTMVFAYEPPHDNFTHYEQQVFIAAFKESPKRWGKIAAALPDPNKTYKDCIHHYYANKWDGRFRDTRTKKLKAGRGRGRGGKSAPRGRGTGAMADLSSTRVDDPSQPLSLTETGRPRRAAAPNHFGEKEAETKAALAGTSKKLSAKQDNNEDGVPEKPGRRRKGVGEKPGRKPKGSQQLAPLAAAPAPGLSPSKHAIQSLPAKDDPAKLEDARLLTGFQAGHAGMANVDNQIVYHHRDGFQQPVTTLQEEHERPKQAPSGQSAKTAPSSYWSVPEQSDFIKYIKYFGTDFAAIAAHMGTKTHIMIKNHYQRQIDNGNRPELEQDAMKANQRRARGEDMGPPPTPTPITKRRYDNPAPAAPRPLAPHVDAMEIEEPPKPNMSVPKHSSPPQLQSQAKFSSPAQRTPISAPVAQPAAPSTLPPTAHPPVASAPPLQPQRFPPGPRLGFFSEQRVEPRQPAAPPVYRNQPTPPSAPIQPPERPLSGPPDPHDPQYLRNLQANLQAERDKALRIQQEESQQERFDQIRRQGPAQQPAIQPSPRVAPLVPQADRKPIFEERVATPQKAPTQPPPQPRHTFIGSPAFGPTISVPPPPAISNRAPLIPSPPKKEVFRQENVPSGPSPPPLPLSKPPEAPKRSNLFGILNSEPEEPKPAKRTSGGDSLAYAPQRTESPLNAGFSNPHSSTPLMSMAQPRADTFMQTAPPSGALHRSALPQPSSTPAPAPPPLKHESSSGPQSVKHEWSRSVFIPSAHGSPVPQPAAAFERDVRPYYHHAADQNRHRTTLSQLNGQVRANPSPPPLGPGPPSHPHSRTPSYSGSGPTNPPPRDPRPTHPSHPQPPAHQQAQPLHNPFSQPPPMQAQNAAHHVHNSSMSGAAYPPLHHRSYSRDNVARQEQQQLLQQRQTEQDWRRANDRANDMRESERQRDAHYMAQRQEHERQQSQYVRGPAPTPPGNLLPGGYGPPPPYVPQGPSMGISLREQSMREAQAATMHEEQRMHQEAERRRHEVLREQQMEEIRRQEAVLQGHRTTPLSGFWPPPRR